MARPTVGRQPSNSEVDNPLSICEISQHWTAPLVTRHTCQRPEWRRSRHLPVRGDRSLGRSTSTRRSNVGNSNSRARMGTQCAVARGGSALAGREGRRVRPRGCAPRHGRRYRDAPARGGHHRAQSLGTGPGGAQPATSPQLGDLPRQCLDRRRLGGPRDSTDRRSGQSRSTGRGPVRDGSGPSACHLTAGRSNVPSVFGHCPEGMCDDSAWRAHGLANRTTGTPAAGRLVGSGRPTEVGLRVTAILLPTCPSSGAVWLVLAGPSAVVLIGIDSRRERPGG